MPPKNELEYAMVDELLRWGQTPIDLYAQDRHGVHGKDYDALLDRHIKILRDWEVRHVLSIKSTSPPVKRYNTFASVLWLPIHDTLPPSDEQMDLAVAYIGMARRAGQSCYVHCRYGLGRSTTVVLGHMLTSGWSFEAALEMAVKQRPEIAEGFTPDQKEFVRGWAVRRGIGRS